MSDFGPLCELDGRQVWLQSGLGMLPDHGGHILGNDAVYAGTHPRRTALMRGLRSRSAPELEAAESAAEAITSLWFRLRSAGAAATPQRPFWRGVRRDYAGRKSEPAQGDERGFGAIIYR
jgi:hypothetical protein